MGVAAPQVGQGQQGLSCWWQPPPPRPDLLPPGCQLSGQEPQGVGGQINRGRVDEHAKLLAARMILVENPSTRSFVVAQDCPTRGQHHQLGKGSLSNLKSRSD